MNAYAKSCVAIILFALAAVAGCKKPKSDTALAVTTSAYHILWSYLPIPGVPSYASYYQFTFTSDAPAGSTVLWNFGDGSAASAAMTPTHTFTTSGSYTITLVVNGDAVHTVTRTLDVYWSLPHAIYCSTTWMKDSLLHFRSNVLPDSTFAWDFGDGTASIDSTPAHAYAAVGTYTVKLTVNGNAASAATTMVNVIDAPLYTAAMGGTRIWHDTIYGYFSTPSTLTYPQPDVSLSMSIINPVQIQFKGTTLTYVPSMSTDSVLRFFSGYYDNTGNNHSLDAVYYRHRDSIVVLKYDRVSAGGSTGEKWVTP
jgi:hypothetical protein